jgi:hypothetical protein
LHLQGAFFVQFFRKVVLSWDLKMVVSLLLTLRQCSVAMATTMTDSATEMRGG